VRIDWPTYNDANGTVHPAIGDLDGDGRGEIVAGLGAGSAGWFQIFEGVVPGGPSFAHRAWRQLDWPNYTQGTLPGATGETHPAVGNVDGQGGAEIVLGLGPGGNGWLAIHGDAASGYALQSWVQVPWTAYNTARGETWPAVGDLDGDGRAEIVAGLGPGGEGWLVVFDDATAGYAPLQWRQLPWAAYNAADGRTHPAVGDLDGDGRAEIVAGLGPACDGWLAVWDDRQTGCAWLAWIQLDAAHRHAPDGQTWPAIGRFNH
jgi:hypothetical protein